MLPLSLTDTAAWSAVVGVVMPWLIAVVNQPQWSRTTRQAVAVVAAVVGGVLTCLATGTLFHGPSTVLGSVMTVLIASQAVYGKLGAASQRKLELLTSPRQGGGRHEGLPPAGDSAAA